MAQPLFRYTVAKAEDKKFDSSVKDLHLVTDPKRLNNKNMLTRESNYNYAFTDVWGFVFVQAGDLNALVDSIEPELRRLEAKIDALQPVRGDLDVLAQELKSLESLASKDARLVARQRLQEVLDYGASTATTAAAEELAAAEVALGEKRKSAELVREQFGEGEAAALLFQKLEEAAKEVKKLGDKHAKELEGDLLAQDPAVTASTAKALEAVAATARLDAELAEAKTAIANLTASSAELQEEMAKVKAEKDLVVECNTSVMQASKLLEESEKELKTKENVLAQAKVAFSSDMAGIEAEVAAAEAVANKKREALEQARREAQEPEIAALRAEVARLKAMMD